MVSVGCPFAGLCFGLRRGRSADAHGNNSPNSPSDFNASTHSRSSWTCGYSDAYRCGDANTHSC